MADKPIKPFWGFMLSAIVAMAASSLLINLIDRYSWANGTAWSFYSPATDMTCMVARSRGQEVMACLPGDHRVEDQP